MKKVDLMRFAPLGYACAEAINTLCTNLTFTGSNVKRIMVTSCHASEGKSMISMNIMRTMAGLGKRVALLDMDLRRSRLRADYGMAFSDSKPQGITHYLSGQAALEDIIYSTPIANACILPVTKTVSNSLSLLNTEKTEELIRSLGEAFDYVIIDVSPVGALIDAAQIARYCDGTLLVVNYNEVRKKELIDARNQLDQTGCPILGTVINEARFDSYLNRKYYYKSYYYSHYDNYYGKDEKGSADPGKPAAPGKGASAGK